MATWHTSEPAGMVAFVFTDLEDSTRRWEDDPVSMGADLARHHELVDRVAARRAGRRAPEQGGGDSTVTAFTRASDALLAALDLQAAMHAERWAGAEPLSVRVAVHAGEVRVDAQGAYSGPTLNRCGRLLQAAHGGQVLASSTVVELGRAELEPAVELVDLGSHRLRGIERPMHLVQLTPPGLPSAFPPPRTLESAGSTVPHPDSSFVGRSSDLDTLAELVATHRVLTIVGAGGCGKTRRAIELAHEALDRFRHGAVWVELSALTSRGSVLDAVASAVGLHTTAAITPERIVTHLADSSMLLLLDNCEHVLDASAELAAAIESECPGVRIVATSREPLALKDEVVWRVPSLDVPLAPDGSDLLDSESGRLLLDRVRQVRPGYEPDGADLAALAAVCRRLDGIPLAIELAAARTATVPPSELAARLADRFSLLAGSSRDVLARQRTIEASVAWSYHLLDEVERSAFRRLSVFSGSFTLAAAAELCGDGPDAEEAVLRLFHCSLLVERPGPSRRLQMLEPIRWYARERLVDSGEADTTMGRHLDWCIELAGDLGGRLEGPGVRRALAALESDLDNLRAAMEWAMEHGRAADAGRIVAATPWFWIWRGRVAEALVWLDRSEAAAPRGASDPDSERLATAWARAALVVSAAARPAESVLAAGLELARECGDDHVEARLLVAESLQLAFIAPQAVLDTATSRRERCRRTSQPFWASTSLVSDALAHISLGRFDLAEPILDELRDEAQASGHPQLLADEIARRALVDRRFGRYDAVHDAVVRIDALTEGFTEFNSPALVHAQAALVDVAQGHAAEALDTMEARYRRYLVAGDHAYLPSIALPIMEALIDLGRAAEVIERFEPVWEAFSRTISWRLRLGSVRAIAFLAAGDTDRARVEFGAVWEAARTAPNDHEGAIADCFLGALDRDEQRFADAETRLHRALEVQARLGYPQYVADLLEELAGIELDHERPPAAAVLFGAASAIRARSGVVRRVGRQQRHDVDVAAMASALDGDELDESWRRGAALSMQDAVDLARRGRGERGRPTRGWESLTATEVKVAGLVAVGRTNPEIAAQLVMGRATVKTHVSNILRKLGVSNRTQVATAMTQRNTQRG